MTKVGIFGVSGYAGQKLVEILLAHPEVEITLGVVAPEEGTPTVVELAPRLRGRIDLRCTNTPDWDAVEKETDVVFLALPHIISMSFVPEILKRGKKVIDLSADFRLKDIAVYERWYAKHACPDLVAEAVYGLPELFREDIPAARLIANPGCYPTSAALAFLPLAKAGLLEPGVIVDSKSGVTGAGRTPSLGNLYVECNENMKAYKIGEHRHAPEMEEVIAFAAGKPVPVLFVPHLTPMNQGILSTCYGRLSKDVPAAELQSIYESCYRDEPFVRVMPAGQSPATRNVVDTNFCDVGVKKVGEKQVVVVSAIDNLVKGASGQAVQNMNLMCGSPEGLPFVGA